MTDPGLKVDLPSGESLFFVEDHPSPKLRHSYWRCKENGERGTRLTGVTTAVKTLETDNEPLLRWAAKTQCIGIAELYQLSIGDPDATHWLSTQESIWSELTEHELTFEHVRERAATEGTNTHELALRALAMGRPVPDFEAMSERERNLAKGVVSFWLDHSPDAEQVEQIVYSSRLGVAGRLDLRCRLSSREGTGVIDLKTGGFISNAHHAQVGGGYPLLAEESGFGASDWALILKVSEDGTYDLIPAQGTPEGFEAAVVAYREAGRINREAAKAWKAAKTARDMDEQIEAMA